MLGRSANCIHVRVHERTIPSLGIWNYDHHKHEFTCMGYACVLSKQR